MNQRTRLTKMMFRQALAELLKDKHISNITIREICEKAELNRSTFYLHYHDVYDLLEEIENEIAREADNAVSLNKENEIRFLKYLKENRGYYRLLLTNNEINFMRRYHDRVLKQLMETVVLNVPEKTREYILSYALEGSMCIVRKWAENGFTESEEEIAGLLFQLSDAVRSISQTAPCEK